MEDSGDTVNLFLNQQLVATDYFDAKGVYVGDSPQTQIGSSLNFKCQFNKNAIGYFKIKGVYFDRHFSDLNHLHLMNKKKIGKYLVMHYLVYTWETHFT